MKTVLQVSTVCTSFVCLTTSLSSHKLDLNPVWCPWNLTASHILTCFEQTLVHNIAVEDIIFRFGFAIVTLGICHFPFQRTSGKTSVYTDSEQKKVKTEQSLKALTSTSCTSHVTVTKYMAIQMNAIEQCFHVILFIMLYKVAPGPIPHLEARN